jgi:hypothetical protein
LPQTFHVWLSFSSPRRGTESDLLNGICLVLQNMGVGWATFPLSETKKESDHKGYERDVDNHGEQDIQCPDQIREDYGIELELTDQRMKQMCKDARK